jgi:hypothetical protein
VVVDGLPVADRESLHEAGDAELAELALEIDVHRSPPALAATTA